MKTVIGAALVACAAAGLAAAQEAKPVPKHSVRVFVPGCSKGVLFVAGRRAEDQPGAPAIPEGTRLRMTGPKALMREIKGHEGSRIELTGLMRKGQFEQRGLVIGGLRIVPGASPTGSGRPAQAEGPPVIDVEGWRTIPGECPSR
jgi:hypothetical protein